MRSRLIRMTLADLGETRGLLASCTLWAALSGACAAEDEAGKGSLDVLLESEDVVVDGLEPGDDVENIRDGWAVEFEKYIVAVGAIDVRLATDASVTAGARDVFVVDLTRVPTTGLSLFHLDGLREGRWEFHFATPAASDDSERHESVAASDYAEMVDHGFTYLIEGVLRSDDGRSCPPAALADPGAAEPSGERSGGNDCYDAPAVRFTFGATADTRFGPCEIDGVPGFSIAAGTTQTVAATLHGDHLFFNGFPEGDEGGIARLAQWLADSDLDLDGRVTGEELERIAPAQLPELDSRFQLGGSPITPLATMHDYVVAQLKTQGHFQGEGECPVDAVETSHEHR